jgi:hypothetical protein
MVSVGTRPWRSTSCLLSRERCRPRATRHSPGSMRSAAASMLNNGVFESTALARQGVPQALPSVFRNQAVCGDNLVATGIKTRRQHAIPVIAHSSCLRPGLRIRERHCCGATRRLTKSSREPGPASQRPEIRSTFTRRASPRQWLPASCRSSAHRHCPCRRHRSARRSTDLRKLGRATNGLLQRRSGDDRQSLSFEMISPNNSQVSPLKRASRRDWMG